MGVPIFLVLLFLGICWMLFMPSGSVPSVDQVKQKAAEVKDQVVEKVSDDRSEVKDDQRPKTAADRFSKSS